MSKFILKDISTSGFLICYGPLLIIIYSSCGLTTALGIFYIFFGFKAAICSHRDIRLYYKLNSSSDSQIYGSYINLKTRLACEKSRYWQTEVEQVKRRARIDLLEKKLATANRDPYRSLPN